MIKFYSDDIGGIHICLNDRVVGELIQDGDGVWCIGSIDTRLMTPSLINEVEAKLRLLNAPMSGINLMVCGHGRSGKDTFCDLLDVPFVSSSYACLEHVIWPQWGKFQNYIDMDECFSDRANHRTIWYDLITAYNIPDRTKLARKIYDQASIYCGIRNSLEFAAVRDAGLFQLSIWVDASERLPAEDTASCTVTPDMCDIIITNNGTLEEFETKVARLKDAIY